MKKQTQSTHQIPPNRQIRITPVIVILVFLILTIVGIGLGEPSQILRLATQICLSCIGLG